MVVGSQLPAESKQSGVSSKQKDPTLTLTLTLTLSQQLSTVGALLQLVVHGPGKYSMDESEGPVQVIALTSKGTD